MATVRNLNVILQIADDKDTIQRYMDKGFSVIDASGNVIKEALPTDIGVLQAKVLELRKENEILKSKLALAENVVEQQKDAESVEELPIVDKPKRGRGRKKQN